MLRNHPNDDQTKAAVEDIIDHFSETLNNRAIVQVLEYFIKKQYGEDIYYSRIEAILRETPLANYENPGNMTEGATCLLTMLEAKVAELKNTASYKALIENNFYTDKFTALRANYQTACDINDDALKRESLDGLRALAASRNPQAERFIQAYDDVLMQQVKANARFSLKRIFGKFV